MLRVGFMKTKELEKELKAAHKHLEQAEGMDERKSARETVLSIERKLAAERNEEYADTIDFPVQWDVGAPLPHLIANGLHTILLFHLQKNNVDQDDESIALVQFYRCVSVKLGSPNDEVLSGHPLYGKGAEFYAPQIVKNSKWIKDLETINKVHPNFNQEGWRSLNHYVFWFHDETFECVAKSYEVEVLQKDMDDVIVEATKRSLT
jgi:hypothetical protein